MNFHWIEPNILCAGSLPQTLADVYELQGEGIVAIVTLTERSLTSRPAFSVGLFGSLGIDLLHVPIDDMTAPNREQAEQVKAFIDTMQAQGNPVYLHCHAGIGRTGTMLHAYYLFKGLSLDEAKEKISQTRPNAQFDMLTDEQQQFLQELSYELRII